MVMRSSDHFGVPGQGGRSAHPFAIGHRLSIYAPTIVALRVGTDRGAPTFGRHRGAIEAGTRSADTRRCAEAAHGLRQQVVPWPRPMARVAISHRMPACNTKRMPLSTAQLSSGG
jgi:hypothetical protein